MQARREVRSGVQGPAVGDGSTQPAINSRILSEADRPRTVYSIVKDDDLDGTCYSWTVTTIGYVARYYAVDFYSIDSRIHRSVKVENKYGANPFTFDDCVGWLTVKFTSKMRLVLVTGDGGIVMDDKMTLVPAKTPSPPASPLPAQKAGPSGLWYIMESARTGSASLYYSIDINDYDIRDLVFAFHAADGSTLLSQKLTGIKNDAQHVQGSFPFTRANQNILASIKSVKVAATLEWPVTMTAWSTLKRVSHKDASK